MNTPGSHKTRTQAHVRQLSVTPRFFALRLFAPGLLALSLLTLSVNSHARAIDETFKTGNEPRVEVSNVNGEIDVSTWSRGQVELTGELDERAELVLEHDDEKLIIRVVKKSGERRIGDTQLRLRVPKAAELSLHSVSGDVRTRDVIGTQRIDVVSGNTEIRSFSSDLDINSVSGDVTAIGTGEETVINALAVSGDINLQGVAGELEATTVSGVSTIDGGEFSRVRLNTTSGDIEFDGNIEDRGRFDAESISGDVRVNLRLDTHLDVDVETFTGRIDSCLSEQPQRKSTYGPGRVLLFKRGDASKDIRVETMSGDVNLCTN